MKLQTILLLVWGLVSFIIPKSQELPESWHDWQKTHLENVTTQNCTFKFNEEIKYYKSSMEIDYNVNSSITFPYRYNGTSLWYKSFFHIAFYSPSSKADSVKVEFLENNIVKGTCVLVCNRMYWNRFEINCYHTEPTSLKFVSSFSGNIPSNTNNIRIKFPENKSGKIYLGRLYLADKTKDGEAKISWDRISKLVPKADLNIPDVPLTITQQQKSEMDQVAEKLEEIFGVADYAKVPVIEDSKMSDFKTRFDSYEIDITGNVIKGYNKMLMQTSKDYECNENLYGRLMWDIAIAYRNTESQTQKTMLLDYYLKLYDFSYYIGGMPDNWSGGYAYIPSVYLMRHELKAQNKLHEDMLAESRLRLGFDRVNVDYSFYIKNYSDNYRGETGEDVDYTRIVSLHLPALALMASSDELRYRDLKQVRNYFSNQVLSYSPTIADGYKPDGVANHHWGWIDQYALGAFRDAGRIVYLFAGGEFKLSESAYQVAENCLKAVDMRSVYNVIPWHLGGKGNDPMRYGGNGQHGVEMYGYKALAGTYNEEVDSEMAQIFLRSIENKKLADNHSFSPFEQQAVEKLEAMGYSANNIPSGNMCLSYGNAMIHRRGNWMLSIKTHSKYQYFREASNAYVTFFGYGYINTADSYWNRYGSVKLVKDVGADGYDWRKIPGATTVNFTDMQAFVNKEYKRYWQPERFSGGLSQDGNGLFSTKIHGSEENGLESFRSRKSWFCFDDYVVSVGSGITNSINEKTITTLYQDKLSSTASTYYNSTNSSISTSKSSETLTENTWLVDSEKKGYWVPKGSVINVKRKSQTFKDYDNKNDKTGTFEVAWLEHGQKPNSANYWYVMRMNTTPTQMKNFGVKMNSANPMFKLLSKTDAVHAVESNVNSAYGITVFDASSDININELKSVSKPCVLMAKRDSVDNLKLGVSYPDLDFIDSHSLSDNQDWGYSKENEVSLVLKGKWKIVSQSKQSISATVDGEETTLSFTVKDGLPETVQLKEINKPELPWIERFNQTNGTTHDNGSTAWNVEVKSNVTGFAYVENGELVINKLNAVWSSESIDIPDSEKYMATINISYPKLTGYIGNDSLNLKIYANENLFSNYALVGRAAVESNLTFYNIQADSIKIEIESRVSGTPIYAIDNICVQKQSDAVDLSIGLNKHQLDLQVEDTDYLTYTVNPVTYPIKDLNWSIVDEEIATIDQSGTIQALKEGETMAIISANNGSLKDTCFISITKPIDPATQVDEKMVVEGVKIAPNPVVGNIKIIIPKDLEISQFELFDIRGNKKMFIKNIISDFSIIPINNQKIGKGVYFVRLKMRNGKTHVEKIYVR
jgi:chondroitin-sulfate-ABC endolyase/exolyase